MITIQDVNVLANVLDNKYRKEHIITFKKKYTRSLRYIYNYTSIPKSIVKYVIAEYLNDEFKITVQLIQYDHNRNHDHVLSIRSHNINIGFNDYHFGFGCNVNFYVDQYNHDHSHYNGCRVYHPNIDNKILTHKRNYPTKDDHFQDVINAYKLSPKQEYVFTNTYYNEINTITYNINNHKLFNTLMTIVDVLTDHIDHYVHKKMQSIYNIIKKN